MSRESKPFDIEEINGVLRSDTEVAEHLAFGQGIRFQVGETGISIDLYPQAEHLQVTTRNMQILMYRVARATVIDEGVAFEGKDHDQPERIWVDSHGDIILYAGSGVKRPTLSELLTPSTPQAQSEEPVNQEQRNKEKPTIVLAGRLKSKPIEGKLDRKGNPTSWARMAVHDDHRRDAHMYVATFHRHTTALALNLDIEDPITVEGYPHPASAKGSMDTFSVIAIHKYPGMKEKE
jgi:hypothetical protein